MSSPSTERTATTYILPQGTILPSSLSTSYIYTFEQSSNTSQAVIYANNLEIDYHGSESGILKLSIQSTAKSIDLHDLQEYTKEFMRLRYTPELNKAESMTNRRFWRGTRTASEALLYRYPSLGFITEFQPDENGVIFEGCLGAEGTGLRRGSSICEPKYVVKTLVKATVGPRAL